MYKIIGEDGREYGPVSLDELKSWVAQGRVNAQTKVRPEGAGDWLPAAQVPELAAVLGASRMPPVATPVTGPGAGGSGSPKSGLAITSFVLGLILCLAPISSVAAILCGHIAHARANRDPRRYGGGGLAIAGFVLGYVGLMFGLLIMPALLLPALVRAKARAQTNQCANNLRELGVGFKMWEDEHNNRFPFQLGTNQGGTLELVDLAPDGADQHPEVHFQVLSNHVSGTKVLVCPTDHGRMPAFSFASLSGANVSYSLHAGKNVNDSNPNEILIECPLHHNVLHVDGSVQEGRLPRRQFQR